MFSDYIALSKGIHSDFYLDHCEILDNTEHKVPLMGAVDDSMGMVAMMLLHNRMPDFKLRVKIIKNGHQIIDRCDMFGPNILNFFIYEYSGTKPDILFDSIRHNFKTIEKMQLLETYIEQKLNKKVYIRKMPYENTVIVLMKPDLKTFHSLTSFFNKYYEVFEDKQLTEEEKVWLYGLDKPTSKDFRTLMEKMVCRSDSFRKYILKYQLENFHRKIYDSIIGKAKIDLAEYENKMEQALKDYQTASENRFNIINKIAGMEQAANNQGENNEISDYLMNNPAICNVCIDNADVKYIVKTYFHPHHIDEWEIISSNINYFSQYVCSDFPTPKKVKILLDGFLSEDRCVKLKMCSYFVLNCLGFYCKTVKNYDFPLAGVNDYIPNPHINYYACIGQNLTPIVTQLTAGDIISAIECTIACTQKINIHETQTFNRFICDLLKSKAKCFVTEEGEELSPKETLQYLEERNK